MILYLKGHTAALVAYEGSNEEQARNVYNEATTLYKERKEMSICVESVMYIRFNISNTRIEAFPTSEPSLFRVLVEGKFV